MAKQLGLINVRGAVGDMLFRKTEDGYVIGRKSSVTGDRIKNDPTFKNTRKAMSEFGRAGKAAKLLRGAVLKPLSTAGDSKLSSRMVKVMMQALKQDTVSDFGERSVHKGEMAFLEGFEFNRKREIIKTFLVPYEPVIDRAAGKGTVDIGAFKTDDVLLIPEEATHFKVFSGLCALDFELENAPWSSSETDYFTTRRTDVPAIHLENILAAGSTFPLVLVVGIRFYRLVNGFHYQLHGDKYDAMRILKVDQP